MYNFEYMNKVEELLHKVDDANKEKIQELAVKFADNIKNNHIIHVFGTGHSHMIGIELFLSLIHIYLMTDVPQRVFPVGRLDYDTTGVLIMTNDGEFANEIIHPRYHIAKVYEVTRCV